MYKVFLANRGNVDYRQNPNNPIFDTESDFYVEIELPIDASEVVRQYIQNNDLGAGSFVGGQIIGEVGEMIGYVSYNGRLWGTTSDYFESNKKMFNELVKG